MNEILELKIIGHIETDFPEKFGIPRQGGITEKLLSRIIFEPEFRDPLAFRGLEGFSHIWVLWEFSDSIREDWSPMVRPPRLGGKKRMGVFATRSPFRPNPIGMSCLKLDRIELDRKLGPVLYVYGADMKSGTPILDIKPYLPYADCIEDAKGGFAEDVYSHRLEVDFPEELLSKFPVDKREAALEILAQDPRPAYQNSPERRYGIAFAGKDIRFHVHEERLTVCEVCDYCGPDQEDF